MQPKPLFALAAIQAEHRLESGYLGYANLNFYVAEPIEWFSAHGPALASSSPAALRSD